MTTTPVLKLRLPRLAWFTVTAGLVLVLTTALARPVRHDITTFACPTANSAANLVIANLKRHLAIANAEGVSFRASMGFVGIDSSAVTTVTDSIVCTRVTQVIDSVTRDTSSASYFVLRAGPRYIATAHLQDRQSLFFLDTAYVFLGVIP